ncbi:hypothetical protein MGYG_00847 [Nannizzia gypsea CBS 118893]|uniref:Clock-controlled protein 6 n=1 Tax=Arthroderma gypseum (strain ATCC MYA-4604 / CBS 118893) TaxID=535722 RepID=E5R228_ARTGP|nr:hypothetical protein MGYG_00847 [Nannizzia gypsea CBS 118893]EFQ97807.1 hypothetical protein MGYG_00847 [Nannizzia gypsea CBS 118893]
MRYSVATVAAMASIASASLIGTGTGAPMPDVTTEVLTNYVTWCPEATTITHGSQTYTVTEPTSLTFTEPCTVTRTLTSSTITECSSCPTSATVAPTTAPGTGAPVPVPTGGSTSIYEPPTYPNSTAQAPPMGTASGTGSMTAPLPTFTGAASHAVVGAGAGLAGVLGLAALLL